MIHLVFTLVYFLKITKPAMGKNNPTQNSRDPEFEKSEGDNEQSRLTDIQAIKFHETRESYFNYA